MLNFEFNYSLTICFPPIFLCHLYWCFGNNPERWWQWNHLWKKKRRIGNLLSSYSKDFLAPPLPWPLQSWPVPTCPFQPRPDPSWPNLPARASSQAKIFSGLFHFISTPTPPPHNLPLLMRYVKIIPKRKKIKVPKQCSLCENITYGSTFIRTNLWRWNLPFNKDKIEGVISPQIILYILFPLLSYWWQSGPCTPKR